MIKQMVKELLFVGLWILGITGVNAQAVTITMQSAPTKMSNTGTDSAYYVVGLSRQFPSSSLTLSYLRGMPVGVTQQLTGTAPCTGGITTLCATNGANQFTLTPGSSCCLAYTLTGSQMALGTNTLQPTVGTSGSPPPYSYNGPSTNVQVKANTTTYTGIYVFTANYRTTYSANNGASWASMLSQQSGFWNELTSAFAVTANGTMYMATGVVGTAGTLIYTSDGTSWAQVNTALPVTGTGDWVQSVFAAGNTVYVGTGSGYVYSTTGSGSVWTQLAQPSQLDTSQVNAVFVDGSGHYYVGTNNGNVYISSNGGNSWIATQQPDGSAVQSLAVSANGNLYAVTTNTRTNSPPYYSTNQGTIWTAMGASAGNTAYAISVSENTVYIGTTQGNLQYTTNNGTNWITANTQPDGSQISYLFINQSNNLSPLFVESYGIVQVNNGQGSIIVKNLSDTTVTNVHAQLPGSLTQVTQDASNCTILPSQNTCTLNFTSTRAYSPQNLAIVDSNGENIYRSGLVFSITPNDGANYYAVYSVNNTTASVVDNTNATGLTQQWSQTNYIINGITENDTGAGGTCKGAIDGACDTSRIVAQYGAPYANYAAGLCYQSTNGTAAQGVWYLPATCELNGGIYFNATTNTFGSCSPVVTSIFSLYSLGALGGSLSSLLNAAFYWSSTEYSEAPQDLAWYQNLVTGGGGLQTFNAKGFQFSVRCSQALTI
jgi:hypothetical protein